MTSASKVQLRLGERVVAEVAFEGEELRIGRMKENDLVINNLAVSRFHAVLRRVGNGFEIEDLGSENGTLVEGQPICGSAGVAPGSAITIGKHTLFLREGGEGTTQPPLPRKSDVWDAAQTYFVAGPVDPAGDEPVAEAHEDDDVAEAVEAEGWEPEGAAEEVSVAATPEAPGAVSSEPIEVPSPLAEATGEPAPVDAHEESEWGGADPQEEARGEREPTPSPVEPQALELPDPDPALGFGEEELVGRAMPDPVAAEAPSAIVEAEEVPSPVTEVAFGVESRRSPEVLESAGQTSLFDFGLTDDLGLSERSLARAGGPQAKPESAPLHAGVIVEREGRVDSVVPWTSACLRVGRAPECDLVLVGSGVSRRHAELTREGTSHAVRDLGSANGVFVNGTRVEDVTLQQGDVIRIDDYTLTFVLDHEPVGGSVRSAEEAVEAVEAIESTAEAVDAMLGADVAELSAAAFESSPDAFESSADAFESSADAVEPSADAVEPSADAVEPTAVEVPADEMPERDLVLADDADLEVDAGEKPQDEGVAREAEPMVWRVEVAIATERLPEAVRRALAEIDAAELVLPAQLRLVRLVRGDGAE